MSKGDSEKSANSINSGKNRLMYATSSSEMQIDKVIDVLLEEYKDCSEFFRWSNSLRWR